MSDLSNLLGNVYESQNADGRPVPQEARADERVGAELGQALSAAVGEAVAAQAPAPAPVAPPAPVADYAPQAPAYVETPAAPPMYAPAPHSGWALGDDDIVPGVVAKRGKKR